MFLQFSTAKIFLVVIRDNRVKFDPDPKRWFRLPKEYSLTGYFLPIHFFPFRN